MKPLRCKIRFEGAFDRGGPWRCGLDSRVAFEDRIVPIVDAEHVVRGGNRVDAGLVRNMISALVRVVQTLLPLT